MTSQFNLLRPLLNPVFFLLLIGVPQVRAQQDAIPDEIEMRINDLINTKNRLSEQIKTITDSPALGGTTQSSPGVTPASKHQPVTMDEIRQRIQLLRRLRQSAQSTASSLSTAQPPTLPPANAVNPQPLGETTLSPAPESTQPPSLAKIDKQINGIQEESVPQKSETAAVAATQVVANAVNHLELGQSLYQTANYDAALKALQSVDIASLSAADALWCELLTALSKRRVGTNKDATAVLRTIANTSSSDYPVMAARWLLTQSETHNTARESLQTISQKADTLIERANQHVQR